jgi:hypothetical protein
MSRVRPSFGAIRERSDRRCLPRSVDTPDHPDELVEVAMMRSRPAWVLAVVGVILVLAVGSVVEAVTNVNGTVLTGVFTVKGGQTARVHVHHRAGQGAKCSVDVVFRGPKGGVLQETQLSPTGGDATMAEFVATAPLRLRAEVTLLPLPGAINGNCIVSVEVLDSAGQTLYVIGDPETFVLVGP